MSSRDDQAKNPLRYAHEFISPGVGGKRVFAVLIPEACRHSCSFCPVGAVRRLPETFRTPHGLARLFLTAFRRGLCDGLYLTAGIPRHPVRAMARVLELLEILRVHHGFRGYIHVKSIQGAEPGQMQKLVHLADRVSYQLEPACRRALLENPMGQAPPGMEFFTSPERAAMELRAALAESARRAPGPLPPAGEGRSPGAGQLALFSTGSPPGSVVSERR